MLSTHAPGNVNPVQQWCYTDPDLVGLYFFSVSLELNWIDSLHSAPSSLRPITARLAAASATCLLHAGGRLARRTRDVPLVPWVLSLRWGWWWWVCLRLIHCWLISHTHRQASPLSPLSPPSPTSLSRFHSVALLRGSGDARLRSRGTTASGCCQAVVIWLDYQPGGNIQPLYSSFSSSLPPSALSIYHLHAHVLYIFSPSF